ncbi:hypothetical protein [Desulfonema ishimotonii]|uniref:hypothetical protein n=1 Tax=Desulfonema ishimotonii TaxID=45657 RepID=UPI00140D33FF|nr:hypothetical protein [Desulfonema ishimotonii]
MHPVNIFEGNHPLIPVFDDGNLCAGNFDGLMIHDVSPDDLVSFSYPVAIFHAKTAMNFVGWARLFVPTGTGIRRESGGHGKACAHPTC